MLKMIRQIFLMSQRSSTHFDDMGTKDEAIQHPVKARKRSGPEFLIAKSQANALIILNGFDATDEQRLSEAISTCK